jgi:hypothetical protein
VPRELEWQDPDATQVVPVQAIPRPRRPSEPAVPVVNTGPVTDPMTGPMTGPAPSSVADGLSPEGLVRRRRPSRNQEADSSAIRPAAVPRAKIDAETAPPTAEPTAGPAGETTKEGLPIRVRQASLVPQLRERPQDEEDSQPLRSPEQVRSIMNALQNGTTRGRLAAAGIVPDAGHPSDQAMDEAATVNLPVVRDEKDA